MDNNELFVGSRTNTTHLVQQYNLITLNQYNSMSVKGKKSMQNHLVEFTDCKLYIINKSGSLQNLPPNFSISNQELLAKQYYEQVKQQKIRDNEKRKQQEESIKVVPSFQELPTDNESTQREYLQI